MTTADPSDRFVEFREYRRSGDVELRNRLIERHQGLAEVFVRRYRGRGVPDDDIRQVALLAILHAVERFDPEVGVEFSTFASRTIDGEVKRYFRDRTWMVRPPRRSQELHLELRRAEEDLAQRLGRSPTVDELAGEVGATVDHVLEAMEAGSAHLATSLDAPVADEEDGATRGDRVLGLHERGFGHVDLSLLIADLMTTLGERERLVVQLRFFENRSQEEIAERIGVSQSYLSRLLRRILLDLRRRLEAQG